MSAGDGNDPLGRYCDHPGCRARFNISDALQGIAEQGRGWLQDPSIFEHRCPDHTADWGPNPSLFWAADPHFYHRRIAELAGRPWPDVDEMNGRLIDRWNSVVGPTDQVMVLGDFAFQIGTPGVLDIVRRLNGILTLVPGNHDRCHPMNGPAKAAEWRDRYLQAGFADVTKPRALKRVGGRLVQVSHFPYEGDSHDGDRFTEWRPTDNGRTFVIHGHVHGKWKQRGRQINVGADAWQGYPVPDATLAAMISAGPAEIPAEPWQGRRGDQPVQ